MILGNMETVVCLAKLEFVCPLRITLSTGLDPSCVLRTGSWGGGREVERCQQLMTKRRNTNFFFFLSEHPNLLGPIGPRNCFYLKKRWHPISWKSALRTSHVVGRLKISQEHEPALCFITQVCSWHEPTPFTTIN